MRIIGGRHRGTKLADLDGDKTRPTADRVRENLFNILAGGSYGKILHDAHIIDLFSGTGALGLEALSRGAKTACFVEKDHKAVSVIRANIARLKRQDSCLVISGNALSLTGIRGDKANLVFADAPYGTGDGLLAVAHMLNIDALVPDALIVIETAKTETLDVNLMQKHHMTCHESRAYGKAALHFLTIAS
ncbi:16S rRNA (guanine(966)-N(2))-methyltransferase RsmD [Candidatus Puniceispirillum sp.]|jgi:16S rRNA (guanine966-N2)-methyltransferase|uniref:16S rRNA (guanine(966)-N(2))-methyltransferase RsmD n=1 Tax=Candidatus Puniceispirillum sp. TaxID=2026719 RepID=UPI001ECBDE9D|nr:16S rRNA (guanine(966)-N(2))-methyltransferase RsmD [Candidatus Puniceispirillum sp.]